MRKLRTKKLRTNLNSAELKNRFAALLRPVTRNMPTTGVRKLRLLLPSLSLLRYD